MKQLNAQDVKEMIDRVGDHIDSQYDYTYSPIFPEGRQDVCAVNRLVEDGSSYGFNQVFLVWITDEGDVQYKEIAETRRTKDYLSINSIVVEGDIVTVDLGSGGSYSGRPWRKSVAHKTTGG